MQVKEVMTSNIAALAPNNTILDAAKSMQAHNIGCMPVCNPDGKVAGILTDRDIVVRSLANNGDPKTTLVKDVMTKNTLILNKSNPFMILTIILKGSSTQLLST